MKQEAEIYFYVILTILFICVVGWIILSIYLEQNRVKQLQKIDSEFRQLNRKRRQAEEVGNYRLVEQIERYQDDLYALKAYYLNPGEVEVHYVSGAKKLLKH